MSQHDREKVQQLKKEKPSVLGSAMSATVTAGVVGTIAFGLFGVSTPGVAEALGNSIPDEVVTKGLKHMVMNATDFALTPDGKLPAHGMALVPTNYNTGWGIQELVPKPSVIQQVGPLEATTQAKFPTGFKIIYHPEFIDKPFPDELNKAAPQADILREKINTLFNHDGKSVGKYIVGNYTAQAIGAFGGYHAGRIAKAKWEERYQKEREHLNPIDRFLV